MVAPSNGLREADVNLAVSIALRRLLESEGATVIMTRTANEALVSGSLGSDLAARAAVGEKANAHVFVSVHHNADIVKESTKNDLEIYYKQGDDGASLQLGDALTHHLSLGVRRNAKRKRLLPGNYKVLRSSRMPAVLTETAYLTNSDDAAFFSEPSGIRAEAEGLFAGLKAYFALDPPVVDRAQVRSTDDGIHQLSLRFASGLPINAGSVRVQVDGQPADGEYDLVERGLTWTFREPLSNGVHTVALSAKNTLGAVVTHTEDIVVERPPAWMHVRQSPPTVSLNSGTEMLLEVRVYDALGQLISDGIPVIASNGQRTQTQNGAARFYITANDALSPAYTFGCNGIEGGATVVLGEGSGRTIRVTDDTTMAPVAGAVVTHLGRTLAATNTDGWATVPGSAEQISVTRRGYTLAQVALSNMHTEATLQAVDDGVLHGKRVMIDPFFGGRIAGTTGSTGLRASDVNLDVALRASAYLQRAGADVFLTRTGDDESAELARVAQSSGDDVDIFVGISFGAPAHTTRVLNDSSHLDERTRRFVGHYPGSTNGQRLAEAIADYVPSVDAVSAVTYVLQQTACPAVLVQAGDITTTDGESLYRAQESRQHIAYAVYQGVKTYFDSDAME
jgi:N-acetylmuramoyl-L-alanine amidase